MTEENKTEYVPYKKMPLQSKAIKITRQMLRELAHVSASQVRDLSSQECMDVINDLILDFQYYLGETCGDKATRWFGYPVDGWILEAHKDPKADDKLDDALIMGNDAILEGECGLFKWVNNLIAYGASCHGDSQYLPTTFDPEALEYPHNKMRLLMEENLGLVAQPCAWDGVEDWVYKVEDEEEKSMVLGGLLLRQRVMKDSRKANPSSLRMVAIRRISGERSYTLSLPSLS